MKTTEKKSEGSIINKIARRICRPIKKPELNETIFLCKQSKSKNKFLRFIKYLFSSDYSDIFYVERIVEFPFVFQNLDGIEPNSKILEFGCAKSKLSIELASLGYQVVGVDLLDYELEHYLNFKFFKGNFLNNGFKDESFDAVVSVSAIEHCGLDTFGEGGFNNGDISIMKEFYRILKPNGKIIMTIPYGKKSVNPLYRVYDSDSLGKLLSNFKILKINYYIGKHNNCAWIPCSREDLTDVDSNKYVQGVACIVAKKSGWSAKRATIRNYGQQSRKK